MKRVAVYGATREIYRNVVPCINSLFVNSDFSKVVLLIEDDDFPYPLPLSVQTINVSQQPWFDRTGPNATKRWTWMVLMKAAMSKLFPEQDRILCLDCDTLVEDNISQIWDEDLDGCYYAAVRQPTDGRDGRFSDGAPYYNCGVLLCNLSALRDGKEDEIIASLNGREWEFCEQDAINALCAGKIKELPGRYNVSNFTVPDDRGKVCIRHFAAWPDWRKSPDARKYDIREEDD